MRELFCDVEVIQDFDRLNQTLVLKEEENNQSVTIKGIPPDSLLLKLDVNKKEYKRRSIYLRREAPFIHKGCDYCLIIPSRNTIVLFELKSLKPKEKDFVAQFAASEIFINYCTELYDFIKCSNSIYRYKRILLSPKYNNSFTSSRKIQDISKTNKCGKTVEIKTPGFPYRINLEKLL
jgi:hypothetical protein